MKTSLLSFFLLCILFNNSIAQSGSCDCWQVRDGSWPVAAFDGTGGAGGPGLPPLYRNDDWSTDTIHLPFVFCYYGDTVTDVYINNNGTISIGSAYSVFTALPFPDSTYSMVAPFWADVDTRDSLSGVVYYKISAHDLVVQWDHVGYYNTHSDKRNTFQLIISDGTSAKLPELKNVGFCYQDMQWTTGDASSGVNGFGGSPATVGVNYGDGINYIQIGTYNDSTFAYDGPAGLNDGILSLSNQSFVFDVCVNNFNVAPILSGAFLCDTVVLCVGDTFSYEADFLSPEVGQITTSSAIDHGVGSVNVISNPGNPSNIFISFVASATGLHSIDIIGTDNGTPAGSVTYTLYFDIQNCPVGIDEWMNEIAIYPNPVNDLLILQLPQGKTVVSIKDVTGKEIYSDVLYTDLKLNTVDWQKGIYFVSVASNERTLTYKIVKQE